MYNHSRVAWKDGMKEHWAPAWPCSAELEALEKAPLVSGLLRSVEQVDGMRFLVPLPATSSRAPQVLERGAVTPHPAARKKHLCTLLSSTSPNGTRDSAERKCSSSESRGSSAEEQLNECSHLTEENKAIRSHMGTFP